MKAFFRLVLFAVIMLSLYLLTRFIIGEGGVFGLANDGTRQAQQITGGFLGNTPIFDTSEQKDLLKEVEERGEYAVKDIKNIFGNLNSKLK